MIDQPLTSVDQSKIMIFFLLLLPSFFLGVVPVLFLGFGLFMMKKNSDFSHIETAVRNCKFYIVILFIIAIFAIYFSLYKSEKENGWHLIYWAVAAAIAFFYFTIINILFLNPLQSHKKWIVKNGIFSSKPKKSMNGADIDIIRGEKLRSFSVADELIKWAKLKEDGHITEEEFNEARKKLLQRS